MMRDPVQTIGNLIDNQKIAFIGSVDAGGFPNLKAMLAPRRREGIRIFYFTTNTSSRRVAQYRENPKACIYFCDQSLFRGVMLRGRMAVLEDAASKELIWQDGDTNYYPLGVTDPDYCVLRFTAESGRYYSNFKSEDITVRLKSGFSSRQRQQNSRKRHIHFSDTQNLKQILLKARRAVARGPVLQTGRCCRLLAGQQWSEDFQPE